MPKIAFRLLLLAAGLLGGAAILPVRLGAQELPSDLLGPGRNGQENFPYVYETGADGNIKVWRTNVVPLWPNKVCFGWTMKVSGEDRVIDLTEILTLSAPSTNWGYGPETVVENGQKATTKMRVPVRDHRLSRAWCIVDGDPPGQYRYDIYFDGKQRGEFVFCAVKVPDDGSVQIEDIKCPYKFDSVQNGPNPGVGKPGSLAYNPAVPRNFLVDRS